MNFFKKIKQWQWNLTLSDNIVISLTFIFEIKYVKPAVFYNTEKLIVIRTNNYFWFYFVYIIGIFTEWLHPKMESLINNFIFNRYAKINNLTTQFFFFFFYY